ncbi:hypothetical protein CDD81_928 [Ophiocordyceps australis]|uniref:ERCC1-like central domain-containing protein n=1 Tax=Ophiocordyceps australis TaxID=1399860 RepID=A0A2C5YET2_9HYPO|nr:hypothetical protein CDD81_928 [Ophiocordyceps australis]
MEDEYGADDALLQAMAATADAEMQAVDATTAQQQVSRSVRIQQPTPQLLDKRPPSEAPASGSKVVQPTPQALPQKRASGSTILVSPRQRGNPVLTCMRSVPWEYSDVPADYVLGLSTCALFLSLKYHRLHPEYVYTRIRNLQGRYNLRILLTMVDISNHEDSLRELSKTSMVNKVTLVLCWSAAEAARYLELYKSYENASFAAIRGQQASSYADRLVDFVTVPRSLNKSDAVALVANFGSLRNAINAEPEQLSLMSGWGGVKVKRWSCAVEEPFRAKKAAKRSHAASTAREEQAARLDKAVPLREMAGRMPNGMPSASGRETDDTVHAEEETMYAAAMDEPERAAPMADQDQYELAKTGSAADETLSGGIAAALAKLRDRGGG